MGKRRSRDAERGAGATRVRGVRRSRDARAGGVATRRDNRVYGRDPRRPGGGCCPPPAAPPLAPPPTRGPPRRGRVARLAAAPTAPSAPCRRALARPLVACVRGAERRQPARRTRHHSVGHAAGVEAAEQRRAGSTSHWVPARNLPWSRRVRAPRGRAYIASAPGAKSLPGAGAGCGEVGRRRAGHGCTSLTLPAPMASRTEYPAGVRRFLPAQGLACGGTECPWEGQFLERRDALGTAAQRPRIPAQVLRSANRGSASQGPCRPSHTATIPLPRRELAAWKSESLRLISRFTSRDSARRVSRFRARRMNRDPRRRGSRFRVAARGAIPRAKDHVSCSVAKHDRRRSGPRFRAAAER